MAIKVSDFYKNKGYVTAYLAINKELRRVCTLRKADSITLELINQSRRLRLEKVPTFLIKS